MTEMQAGRELDALVAEKVMGGHWKGNGLYSHVELDTGWLLAIREPDGTLRVFEDALPAYDTDIAAAWEVVEKMRVGDAERSSAFELMVNSEHGGPPEWWARFGIYVLKGDRIVPSDWFQADTAPLAICRAALAAVEAMP